ncbi:hypothetical protein DFS34DRAFT_690913 [Phlyctochytrium arcticum]|nr:hypothetical protein DFS34DRAFT_690913 [Phlyctochytrium arcticum]
MSSTPLKRKRSTAATGSLQAAGAAAADSPTPKGRSNRRVRTVSDSPAVGVPNGGQGDHIEPETDKVNPYAHILEDLTRSRKAWATAMFPPFHTAVPDTMLREPQPLEGGGTIEYVDMADIVIGPHIFAGSRFWRVVGVGETGDVEDEGPGPIKSDFSGNGTKVAIGQPASQIPVASGVPTMPYPTSVMDSKGHSSTSATHFPPTSRENIQDVRPPVGRPPGVSNVPSIAHAATAKSTPAATNTTIPLSHNSANLAHSSLPQTALTVAPIIIPDSPPTAGVSGVSEVSRAIPKEAMRGELSPLNESPPLRRSILPAKPPTFDANVPPHKVAASTPPSKLTPPGSASTTPPASAVKPTTAAEIFRSAQRSGKQTAGGSTSLYGNPYFSFPYPFWTGNGTTATTGSTSTPPPVTATAASQPPSATSPSYPAVTIPITTGTSEKAAMPASLPLPPPSVTTLPTVTSLAAPPSSGPPTEWSLSHWSQVNSFLSNLREKRMADLPLTNVESTSSLLSKISPSTGNADSAVLSSPVRTGSDVDLRGLKFSSSSTGEVIATLPNGTKIAWQPNRDSSLVPTFPAPSSPSTSTSASLSQAFKPNPNLIPSPSAQPLTTVPAPKSQITFEWAGPGAPPADMTSIQSLKRKGPDHPQPLPEDDTLTKRLKTTLGNDAYSNYLAQRGLSNPSNASSSALTPSSGSVTADWNSSGYGAYSETPGAIKAKKQARKPRPPGTIMGGDATSHVVGERDPITGEIVRTRKPRPRRRTRPLLLFELPLDNPGVKLMFPADGIADVISTTRIAPLAAGLPPNMSFDLAACFYLPPYRGGRKQPQQGVIIHIRRVSSKLTEYIREAMYDRAQAVRKLAGKAAILALPGLTPDMYRDIAIGKGLAVKLYGPLTDVVVRKAVVKRRPKPAPGATIEEEKHEGGVDDHKVEEIEVEETAPDGDILPSQDQVKEDIGNDDVIDVDEMDVVINVEPRRVVEPEPVPNSESFKVLPAIIVPPTVESGLQTPSTATTTTLTSPTTTAPSTSVVSSPPITTSTSTLNVLREIAASAPATRAPSTANPSPAGTPVTGRSRTSSISAAAGAPNTRSMSQIPRATGASSTTSTTTQHAAKASVSPPKRGVPSASALAAASSLVSTIMSSATPTTRTPVTMRTRKVQSRSCPSTPALAPASLTTPSSSTRPTSPDSSGGSDIRRCIRCASSTTPMWRRGPDGPKTLCNACGVKFMLGKLAKNEQGEWVEGKRRSKPE